MEEQVPIAQQTALPTTTNRIGRASIGAQFRTRLQESTPSLLDSRIAFYSGHLCERGTDTALFDYADCAETILGLRAFVLYDVQSPDNFSGCVAKFRERFQDRLIGVERFDGIDAVLSREQIRSLYMIKIVDDGNLSRVPGVRNLVHAVFFARRAHGDVYARISPCVPAGEKEERGDGKATEAYPIVPHMIRPAEAGGPDMRHELKIPSDATVFGRYGGWETFDIPFAREAIVAVAQHRPKIFFLLMNSPPIWDPLPNVIHVDKCSDAARKAAFIRTCDAMLHARQGGESFGLAIGEFSAHNKPVLTSSAHHDSFRADFHLTTLRAKPGCSDFFYHDRQSLVERLIGFDREAARRADYNAYRDFEPEQVMRTFQRVFLTPREASKQPAAAASHASAVASAPASNTASASAVATASASAAVATVAAPTEGALAPAAAKQSVPPDLLEKLTKLDAEVGALVRVPAAPELSFGPRPRRFVCVFKPYVLLRLMPTTCAAAMSKVLSGEELLAVSMRGRWVRIQVPRRPSDGAELERWVLTWHPIHGELLRQLDPDDDGGPKLPGPGAGLVDIS